MEDVMAKVAAIISEYRIALNVGEGDGVQVGDTVTLFNVIGVVDPETKEHLGDVEVPKLTLEVEDVQPKLSIAVVTDEFEPDDLPQPQVSRLIFGRRTIYKRVTADRKEVNRRTVYVKTGEEALVERQDMSEDES